MSEKIVENTYEEMLENIGEETIEKVLEDKKGEAEDLLNDVDKMEQFLEKLEKKLALVPMIGDKLTDVPVLISMVRSYVKKEYTEIPLGAIIGIVAALIYFVSPADLIADAIPVVGYLDDIVVLGWVLKMVHDDLDEYREWKKNKII